MLFAFIVGVMFLVVILVLLVSIRRTRARGWQIHHDPENMDMTDRDPWPDILIGFAIQSVVVSIGWSLLIYFGFVSWWTWLTSDWLWLAAFSAVIAVSIILALYVHEVAAGYWQWDSKCTIAVVIVALVGGLASYFTVAIGLVITVAGVAILLTEGWWEYKARKSQLAGE